MQLTFLPQCARLQIVHIKTKNTLSELGPSAGETKKSHLPTDIPGRVADMPFGYADTYSQSPVTGESDSEVAATAVRNRLGGMTLGSVVEQAEAIPKPTPDDIDRAVQYYVGGAEKSDFQEMTGVDPAVFSAHLKSLSQDHRDFLQEMRRRARGTALPEETVEGQKPPVTKEISGDALDVAIQYYTAGTEKSDFQERTGANPEDMTKY